MGERAPKKQVGKGCVAKTVMLDTGDSEADREGLVPSNSERNCTSKLQASDSQNLL